MLACLCQVDEGGVSELSSSVARIEQGYREALRKSEGDSSRQIRAKQQYQEKLRRLGKKHFVKLEASPPLCEPCHGRRSVESVNPFAKCFVCRGDEAAVAILGRSRV